MPVIDFIDRSLQLEDGAGAILARQRGLKMLVRPESGGQRDRLNGRSDQGRLLPFRLAIHIEVSGKLMGQIDNWSVEGCLWRDRVQRPGLVRIFLELVTLFKVQNLANQLIDSLKWYSCVTYPLCPGTILDSPDPNTLLSVFVLQPLNIPGRKSTPGII